MYLQISFLKGTCLVKIAWQKMTEIAVYKGKEVRTDKLIFRLLSIVFPSYRIVMGA